MRPLPTLQRRRAALVSLGGHGTLLALLVVFGIPTESPPLESRIITAELVPLGVPPSAPASSDVEPSSLDQPLFPAQTAPRVPTEAPPAIPAPPDDAQVAAPLATAAAPLDVAPLGADDTTPPPEPAPPRGDEPAADSPPLERVAAAEESAPVPDETGVPRDAPATETTAATIASTAQQQRALRRRLDSWTGRFGADEPPTTLAWRADGAQYTAVLRPLRAGDAMGMEQLAVEVSTERDGTRLTTELRMNRIAFSSFAQFIDRWDPEVQIHDDVIDGRFHSNSEIRVSREGRVQPVFNGKVTLAARTFVSDSVGHLNRRTMFPAGLETSVRRIVLPPRAATFDPAAIPAGRLHRFERDTAITFHADGSFDARELTPGATQRRYPLGDEPFYLLGGEDVTLHVQGIVNGKVLVYTPETIVIRAGLRYAADPRHSEADDYLGLVAERTVEIDEPEVTGPGDLEVHASIYARSRFAVRSYRSRRSGTLMIYGSVTAGSVSATEPRFATKIEFDDRLTTVRAPGFPLSDRYELDAWSGEWRVEPGN